ncbi:MAG: undecaprenyl-diphosphatase UppP [Desulfuromonadales bacterium]
MTLFDAIILGAVQGATEFLPVSSSGHLVLAQHLLGGFSQPGIVFDVTLHLGTLLAIVIYFWRDVRGLCTCLWRRDPTAGGERRLLVLLIAGSIPTAIIGLTFKDQVEAMFENPQLVACMLLVTGTLLFIADRYRPGNRREGSLTVTDALITGIAQGAAIIPGISRSGSTIVALLLRGVSGETAARFSFLLSMPAVAGAALLSLKDAEQLTTGELPVYLAGAGAAMIVGLLAIHLMLGILRRRRLGWFAVYCWLLGAVALALLH